MTDPDLVSLLIGGTIISGWQSVRVSRGIERMPNDFDIALTELYPGETGQVVIPPGSSCVLKLGNDVVVTGYVDRYVPSVSARSHEVRIQGRGKCQDLVDCSALIDGMSLNAASALKLAQDLAKPFGITASLQGTEAGTTIPQITVNIGETPFELIDKVSRYRQVLSYEGADGNLVLAQVGTTKHASGFAQGVNVEAASGTFSMDQRFSTYRVYWTSTDSLSQVRAATGGTNGNQHGQADDPSVPRYRPRLIVSEQTQNGVDIGQRRAEWEMNRRNGRSQVATLTCDSWRDSAGLLWQPNMLAPIDLPAVKVEQKTWIISEVTYRRDENGTHADLVLMPPEAFALEPSTTLSGNFQVFNALQPGNAAATANQPAAQGDSSAGAVNV